MGWLLIVLAVIVALAGVVVGVGARLPETHVARVRARIDQSPLEVFAAIRDVVGAKEWRSGLKRVEVVSKQGEALRWKEQGSDGEITFLREEVVPSERLVYRIDDPTLPFGGRWIYELYPEGKGTQLTITEEGTVRNPIFRFMSRFVFGHYRTVEQYLKDLGRHFEEPVEPERLAS